MGCVLNDGYAQRVVIPEVADFASAFTNALDLLKMLDLEASICAKVTLDEQCYEDGPLRVCVDTAAGTAVKGSYEEWSAC